MSEKLEMVCLFESIDGLESRVDEIYQWFYGLPEHVKMAISPRDSMLELQALDGEQFKEGFKIAYERSKNPLTIKEFLASTSPFIIIANAWLKAKEASDYPRQHGATSSDFVSSLEPLIQAQVETALNVARETEIAKPIMVLFAEFATHNNLSIPPSWGDDKNRKV